MLYHLFQHLDKVYDVPGAGMFKYISFRASAAIILSLFISLIFGKRIINYLAKKQIGETVRDLGLEGQYQKQGTPTMGGLIILGAILIPTLLFAQLNNVYIILMIITTVWLGFVGFVDDYIKVVRKDKSGLGGKFKIAGQVIIGLIVGITMYFHPAVVIREKILNPTLAEEYRIKNLSEIKVVREIFEKTPKKSTKSTIPFVKNNQLDYAKALWFLGKDYRKWAWLIFIPIVIFIVTAVSNGANMTDGLDGLAAGTSAIIGTTLGILAYVSGNILFANYLNIMYIPDTGELTIFISAFVGACIGFLWYNTYPAQVFMGDTGSLSLGGIIAVFAIIIRKELLIPILCGIFLIENGSVLIQRYWFKYTRIKYGQGRRVFLMAPIHHHYQKQGYPEAKIVTRFLIVGIMLAVITVVTLKIR